MNSPLVKIGQAGRDIGWGKLASAMPKSGEGAELTLHDVHLGEGLEFNPGGPFEVTADDKRFEACRPTNFRNLRPGCDYERVIFETDRKPKIR